MKYIVSLVARSTDEELTMLTKDSADEAREYVRMQTEHRVEAAKCGIAAYTIKGPDMHERVDIGKPTPEDYCKWWRDIDAEFRTTPDSPLHHDHRCELHKNGVWA